MRLPSDATLIAIDSDRAEGAAVAPSGALQAAVLVRHLIDVWRSVALPVVRGRRAPPDETDVRAGETVFDRPADGLFAGTGLDDSLSGRGCTTLVVCGDDRDGAVEATVRDAAALGYRIFVVADACICAPWPGQTGETADIRAPSLDRIARDGATIVGWRTAWIAAKGAGWGAR